MSKAYYTVETDTPEEPIYVNVEVTTEHPLSSYGQPVVIADGEATPAQSFPHTLFCRYGEGEEAQDLVAKANRLSGNGGAANQSTVAETKAAFAGFFSD